MDLGQILSTFALITAVICVISVIAFIAMGYWISQRITHLATPDIEKLEAYYQQLQSKFPNAPQDELINRIIHEQALKCGVIGLFTGVGGFFFLPITLPLDIFLSLQVQANLVQFIAAAYGHAQVSEAEEKIRTSLIMTGVAQATETATGYLTTLIGRFLQKFFSKIIPFAGAAISFGVNYFIARGVGKVAQLRYRSAAKVENR
ncbi:MAG: EcsC family protein [Anaerolineae bacterium]|jgi:hypothetical protein|nr:EcsC family protein [Anaerolineae bacterium]